MRGEEWGFPNWASGANGGKWGKEDGGEQVEWRGGEDAGKATTFREKEFSMNRCVQAGAVMVMGAVGVVGAQPVAGGDANKGTQPAPVPQQEKVVVPAAAFPNPVITEVL